MSKPIRQLLLAAIAAVCIGVLIGSRNEPTAIAMTAHGTAKKSMATVPLDLGLEAVVTLDHVSGDLTGYVLNRINGQFFIRYRYNVSQQFPKHSGNYLIAAGLADFRGFRGNDRIANGVIYVSEETSQRVVAYALPWNPSFATSTAKPRELEFVALDQAQTRFTAIR
jgi:hypothetical protein